MGLPFLAKYRGRREDLSTTLTQDFGGGEELGGKIEGGNLALGEQADAALPSEVGETLGDIGIFSTEHKPTSRISHCVPRVSASPRPFVMAGRDQRRSSPQFFFDPWAAVR